MDTEEGKLSLRNARYSAWAESTVGSLVPVRDYLWREVLQGLGAVRTSGAFYFLVPLPPHVRVLLSITSLQRSSSTSALYND